MTNINESKLYALLIGINYYESIQTYPQLYKNLGGCVRDIDLVDSYLRDTLGVPSEQIWKLTAPVEESNELSAFRAAQGNILPTYANIVNAFAEITAVANPGEQVYIHYSGHGGRAVTIYPELEGKHRQDEGIVPMDIGNADGRYLRDVEMATLLKRLNDKGCIVTVIFDSCHSGGATRGDCAIRGNENNLVDSTARNQDSLVAERQELLDNWRILTQVDPDLSGGWLPNKDYIFIAACRPTEYAYEYAVNGGQRNGALTYWMMDTLTSSTSVLTYKSLYSRIKGMIQSKFPQQLPMLIGDGDRLVFGDRREYKPYTVTVIKVAQDSQEITLDAGLVAGLSSGTRFAIYPVDVSDFSDKTQQIAIAELTDDIEADKSSAKILDAAAGGIEVKGKIEPGASAVMVAAPVDLIRKVRLFANKQAGDKEQDLPTNLVDKQTVALEKVRQALKGNGWVVEVKDGEEGHFQVAVARDSTYEICIGMPLENLRPALSIEDPDAPQKVCDRLVHLAKYQSVQALENSASKITEYLEFELLDRNKQAFADPNNIELKQGETVFLRLRNTFPQALNVAILDLEPTWEISQLPIQNIEASFFQLDRDQQIPDIELEFELPERVGYEEAKETLKVFATKGVANFQWLLLPSLDKDMQSKGNLNRELEQQAEQMRTRGETITINPLNDLLSTIGADIDEPPVITRKAKTKPNPNADWATQEIRLTVKR
ncbi:caspase family protein [Pleurocapsa sp. PCC 7319]|uniref:caspase family protein n=1 Tax=Pleurocapsa sp. PCC 7319 TaxID=118161 RepID=UPI00034672D0|nr:caspase family protein [Pleurocapsa sp. PCC 7319]